MCGIVGILGFENIQKEESRRCSMLSIFTEILQLTQVRGQDATGVTALFDNGDFMIQKHGIPSSEFISKFGGTTKDYEGFIKLCKKNKAVLNVLLGHCRKTSIGDTTNNKNNHPIKAGEIVGIHNGTLSNHEEIFKNGNFKKDGKVDSEAIFRLIQKYTNNGKDPFTLRVLKETMARLEGSYSVLGYNINNPYQVFAFRDLRPMEMVIIKPLKIMVIASEITFIEKALFSYNTLIKLHGSTFSNRIIKKEDIDSYTLPNDWAGIIDLTRDITKNTKVTDLISLANFRTREKLWLSKSKHSYGYGYGCGYYEQYSEDYQKDNRQYRSVYNTADDNKDSDKPKDPVKDGKKTNTDVKIFCKKLNKYIDPKDVENYRNTGAVILNSKTGEKEHLDKSDKDIPPNNIDSKIVKKEVDVSLDPAVFEASEECSDSLMRYSNNKELANDLEIVDPEKISIIPTFALANRIKKMIFKNAFLQGAKYYKTMIGDKKSAQDAIRTSKNIVEILAEVVERSKIKEKNIKNMVKDIFDKKTRGDLNLEKFKSVFSKGNCEKHKSLSVINSLLDNSNGKKDNIN